MHVALADSCLTEEGQLCDARIDHFCAVNTDFLTGDWGSSTAAGPSCGGASRAPSSHREKVIMIFLDVLLFEKDGFGEVFL